jgi:hypothetical protein
LRARRLLFEADARSASTDLAGLRGCGKTTLIRGFTEWRPRSARAIEKESYVFSNGFELLQPLLFSKPLLD